jgi:D-alanyl-lipoteichoic acid acyltransferase DltB (MBOAT superfamily)
VALVTIAARYISASPFVAGWIGAVGLLLMLHFGLFHILSVAWRQIGIAATPIMRTPLFAASLADFWGKRWNLAFRDFAHTFVFRPTHRRTGAAAATMLVFLASGLIHDLVISLPAKAGYGWPTVYFLLQGGGLLLERTKFAMRLGIGRGGIIARAYTLLIVLAPVGLLFHRPFIENVIAPLLTVTPRI